MKRQGYGAAEITIAKEKNKLDIPEEITEPEYHDDIMNNHLATGNEDYFAE